MEGHQGINRFNRKDDPLQNRSAWKIRNGQIGRSVSGFENGKRISAVAIVPMDKIITAEDVYLETEAPTDSDKKRELKEKIVKTLKENKEVPKPTIH